MQPMDSAPSSYYQWLWSISIHLQNKNKYTGVFSRGGNTPNITKGSVLPTMEILIEEAIILWWTEILQIWVLNVDVGCYFGFSGHFLSCTKWRQKLMKMQILTSYSIFGFFSNPKAMLVSVCHTRNHYYQSGQKS